MRNKKIKFSLYFSTFFLILGFVLVSINPNNTVFAQDEWQFINTSTGREGTIQTWTVPSNGNYRITAYGAQGGGSYGGLGAKISGDFELEEGVILEILVGQEGQSNNPHGGGVGGTFVIKNGVFNSGSGDNSDIYVIAGGGGANGSINEVYEQHGRITGSGGAGFQSGSGGIGSPGNNGSGGTGDSSAYGGAGFIGNGDGGAQSFINGGLGESRTADGGFGGGGGADTGWARNAGGGGYSGGAGARGSTWSVAGGGGSYNAGANQNNESGVRQDHGLVVIEKLEASLEIIKQGVGGGIITSNPVGINCGVTCQYGFEPGAPIVLTAEPFSGHSFISWGGGCVGTNTECTLEAGSHEYVTAKFGKGDSSSSGSDGLIIIKYGDKIRTISISETGVIEMSK